MQTAIAYNGTQVKHDATKEDIKRGFKLWLDLVNPSPTEICEIKKIFNLDGSALETMIHKSKKPQVRVLENHKFTIILDIRYKTFKDLVTESIYLFHSTEWLITIHSENIDLITNMQLLFEQKNTKVMEATIDALYYNILSEITGRYELLLTSIELAISDFGQRSVKKRATNKILEQLDTLTRQIILLRRHFWKTREIMNFLTHMEQDNDEVIYLQIAHDNINDLIELVESFRDTINSTRDLYMASISMQMNDTMRILTIFTAILLPLTLIPSIYGMYALDLTNIGSIPIGFFIVVLIMIIMVSFYFCISNKNSGSCLGIMIKQHRKNKTMNLMLAKH